MATEPTLELIHLFDKFSAVKSFVFDIDGVFTDNTVLVMENGELLRTMNVRDGFALKRATQAGYKVAIITGGRSQGVALRMQSLGVSHVFSGIQDKLTIFEDYCARESIDPAQVLYMGDDMADIPVMRRVGLPVCPSDSIPEVIKISAYVSPLAGGKGCVRDVLEKVLKLQGKWEQEMDF